MTPLSTQCLLLACFFLPITGGAAASPYWFAETAKLVSVPASGSVVQLDSVGEHAVAQVWKSHWIKPATERWNDEALSLIVKYRVNPLRAARMLAMLHVAMHDARLRAETLGFAASAQSAATHVAASGILAHFFPLESSERFEAMGESALAALSVSKLGEAHGIALGASIGRGVARLAVLHALNDGADEIWDVRTRPAEKPGVWRGAPPLDSAHPQEALAGNWQTWILKNGAEFQPPPPPAHDSEMFLRAAEEVLDVSRQLTPEQKRIAAEWHLDQGTFTPPGVWNHKARDLAERYKLPEKQRLRLMSLLNVALFDASIACWHAKYAWWVQRPATTIRGEIDKTYMPYLVTPPHPSYVSGHATISGSAAEILRRFFPGDAGEIDAWAQEAAMSRLYGGIHYRFDNDAGLALGRQVGKAVLERALPVVHDSSASIRLDGHPAVDALQTPAHGLHGK